LRERVGRGCCLGAFELERLVDLLEDSLRFLENFFVPKTHDSEAACSEVFRAPLVVGGLRFISVLSAIKFDYQACFEAAEVREKVVYRMVATKFGAGESPAVKQSPQFVFGLSLIAP
jgi:hypothetical protein